MLEAWEAGFEQEGAGRGGGGRGNSICARKL